MRIGQRPIMSQFVTLVRPVLQSARRWHAVAFVGGLIAILLVISGLDVVGSFINRDFMTALEQRQPGRFFTIGLIYAGVFILMTGVAVMYRFMEERFGLFWRRWLTDYFLDRYLQNRAYYRVSSRVDIDNPDQRITEDVKTFTTTTISLMLVFLKSTVALIAFSGVLWSITPLLLVGALAYAAVGSLVTYLLGRRLVALNAAQFKREADLRYELVLVREHAQPVALARHETSLGRRLRDRLGAVVENLKRIIGVSRNLGFFTTWYTYLIQIIPVLIVAPLYLQGEVQFGVVTQAMIAFGHVLGAFSLLVNEFQRLSTFAAVIGRLGVLWDATGVAEVSMQPVETTSPEDKIIFEHLTLKSPDGQRTLVRDLSLEVPPRGRLLILGADACGKSSLLRAVAGLKIRGTGRLVHPPPEHLMILPGMPYLTEGSLREQLVVHGNTASDSDMLAALARCGLEHVVERAGGLDVEGDWPVILSPSEQQRLAFARLLLADPPFALLDEAISALDAEVAQSLYAVLSDTQAGYVSVAHTPGLEEYHDTVLEIHRDGTWEVHPTSRPAAQVA